MWLKAQRLGGNWKTLPGSPAGQAPFIPPCSEGNVISLKPAAGRHDASFARNNGKISVSTPRPASFGVLRSSAMAWSLFFFFFPPENRPGAAAHCAGLLTGRKVGKAGTLILCPLVCVAVQRCWSCCRLCSLLPWVPPGRAALQQGLSVGWRRENAARIKPRGRGWMLCVVLAVVKS